MNPNEKARLQSFVDELCAGDPIVTLNKGLIGKDAEIHGPVGALPMLYADYAASGRALAQVEDFIITEILAYYSNAHTEASYCGAFINSVRAEARAAIASICNAGPDYAVIFTGAGATAGVNRLVDLMDVRQITASSTKPPLVLLGPYEHHSNILPWRESGADIIEIPEAEEGGPDRDVLEQTLRAAEGRRVVGAFSAASNVTGIISDVAAITALLKRHGASVIWDYAGGAPYLPIDMTLGGGIDAVVLSPHKFIGGPGASGVLIIRKDAAVRDRPSAPGGGTVSFVSPWSHHYAKDLTTREEAGTPNVLGDIRAGLALMIKAAIGDARIASRNEDLRRKAADAWAENPHLEILGSRTAPRLPILSFRVRDGAGGYVHHQLITRMLSDYFGVQARGGCACAGPYAHRLLNLDRAESDALWAKLEAGDELAKPGWVRVNFSYLMDDEEAERLTDAVNDVACTALELAEHYECDRSTARFRHK